MPSPLIGIFTTDTIPGHTASYRVVSSPIIVYTNGRTFEDAVSSAKNQLRITAARTGANAILGAGFSHDKSAGEMHSIVASGTAVFVDPPLLIAS